MWFIHINYAISKIEIWEPLKQKENQITTQFCSEKWIKQNPRLSERNQQISARDTEGKMAREWNFIICRNKPFPPRNTSKHNAKYTFLMTLLDY